MQDRHGRLRRPSRHGRDPRGEILDPDPKKQRPRRFKTDVLVTDNFLDWLKENGVPFEVKSQSTLIWTILSGPVSLLLIMGLLYFLVVRQMRSVGRGAMSFGKSRARLMARDKNLITFAEVAGINEAKEEVQEVIEFLKDPKKFQKLGGRIPKGVLLVGPPGTGKTLLARAIAGEAQVPFFTISGSDFVEMFVGVGASRVRDMFEQAKKSAPCIIFIDEIDAVGRSARTNAQRAVGRDGWFRYARGRDHHCGHQPAGCAGSGAVAPRSV